MSGLRGLFGPYRLARLATAAALAAGFAFVWLTLQLPVSDVALRATPQGPVTVQTTSAAFVLHPAASVTLRNRAGEVEALVARDLAAMDAAALAGRARLAGWLRAGPVTAQTVDVEGVARRVTILRRSAHLSDLTASYWQIVLCSAVSMLFGIGVWLARRRDAAAAWFAGVGVWLFVSGAVGALSQLWTVATPAWAVNAIVLVSAATLHLFALSFVALFVRFPTALASPRAMWSGLAAVATLAAVTVAISPWDMRAFGVLQMVEYAVLLALVVAQLVVARGDRAKRPTLVTLVASIGVGILLYLLVTLLPMVGVHAPLGEAVAFPLFCLIYAGIGLSIVGAGVFTFDGWSRSIMLSVTFSAVVLVVDLALLRWLTTQQDVALGVSVAAVTLAYLPLREWLSRRAERRRDARIRRALRLATDLAFAATEEARVACWRGAVEAVFLALETTVDPAPAAQAQIAQGGVALQVPAVAGAPALVSRHADGGRRAFRRDDIDTVNALVALVTQMVEARDAFVQGAIQERGRIARDLHDNVGGRLLTSLHRRDVTAMQHDVRDAMADIRTIISSLDGEARRLGELLGDLRHEFAARCDGAGLTLDWPLGPDLEDARPASAAFCRHVTALMRESLSNVLRHAGASRVVVQVAVEGARLTIRLTDDGRGLSETDRRGHGLANCAERAGLLGGSYEAVALARGTQVRFDAKLDD